MMDMMDMMDMMEIGRDDGNDGGESEEKPSISWKVERRKVKAIISRTRMQD